MKEESERRAQAKKIRSHRSRSKSEEIAKEDLGRGAKEKRSPFSREGRNASETRGWCHRTLVQRCSVRLDRSPSRFVQLRILCSTLGSGRSSLFMETPLTFETSRGNDGLDQLFSG